MSDGNQVVGEKAQAMAVTWFDGDPAPNPTTHLIKVVRVRACSDQRILRVTATTDAEGLLEIYVDVP